MDFRKDISSEKYKNQNKNVNNKKVESENINQDMFYENLNKYKNFSQSELMQEFLRIGGNLKQNGQLTEENKRKIFESLSVMLDDEQKQKLMNLLGMF